MYNLVLEDKHQEQGCEIDPGRDFVGKEILNIW